VRLLALPAAGKPSALNAAIQAATGEILFITDVRQPLEPASLRRLVACFADPRVGAASGDLVLMQGETAGEAAIDAYRRFESWLRIKLSTLDSMFGATGAIYAIRRRLVRPMPADLLLDDSYLPLHAFFQGYRLVFEPEARAYDYPAPVATEFRRKVRTLAGVWQLLKYYPQLLGPANRMWLDFVSYKLGRLLLPFLLLAVAASSFFLPGPWRTAALGAQATGYLAALADPLVPERFALKRLTGPARTFVVMMAAAALAVQVWFVPAQRLWKVTQLAAPGARR
jgi:cellulose synthase/poly-beta-1,6-N-acetylglucosamine synthase-like glycosyltransferase